MPILEKHVDIVTRIDPITGLKDDFDKPYLLLLVDSGCKDKDYGEFRAMRGRRETCEAMLSELGNYNLLCSHILSGGITFGNEVTLYTFLRLCLEKYKLSSEFDVQDDLNNIVFAEYSDDETMSDKYLNTLYLREINKSIK